MFLLKKFIKIALSSNNDKRMESLIQWKYMHKEQAKI